MSALYLSLAGHAVNTILGRLEDDGFNDLGSTSASTEIVAEVANNTDKKFEFRKSEAVQGNMQHATDGDIAPRHARAWTQRSTGLDGSFGWVIYEDDDSHFLFVGYCVYFDNAPSEYLVKYSRTDYTKKKNDELLAMLDKEGVNGGTEFTHNGITISYSGMEKSRHGVAQARALKVTIEYQD